MQYELLAPGPSGHTFEIWLLIQSESEFGKLAAHLEKTYGAEFDGGRVTLMLAGLEVKLVPGEGCGSLYLKVTPAKLLDATVDAAQIIEPDAAAFQKASRELKKRLKLLKLPDDLSEYSVVRVDLCVNIKAEKNSAVREWLRLMRKRLTPACCKREAFNDKRLSRKENRACDVDYYRMLTPHGTFVCYDKHKQSLRCGLLGVDRMPKRLLRMEWQLTDASLREMKKRYRCDGLDLVLALLLDSAGLFEKRLSGLYYEGEYRKEPELIRAINASDYQEKTRERMIAYVRWSKKHGEDKATEKFKRKYDCGDKTVLRMRRRFEKLNIQPVPLRKNFREDTLEPPEESLLRLLEEQADSGIF